MEKTKIFDGMVDEMLQPSSNWYIFNSNEEKLSYYKLWKFCTPSTNYIKTIYYTGVYTKVPAICDIVGFTDINLCVIKIDNNLHCIQSDYLLSMQPSQSLPVEYVVFDLETTGFSYKDKIIEIGAVKIKGNTIIDTFDELINPECIISPIASRVNHINKQMVDNCPTIDDILPQFLSFITNLPLVAHNASFDVSFIKKICSKPLRNQIFDTLALSRKAFPELKSHSLQELKRTFNISVSESHRSLPDTQATAIIFQNCFNKLYAPSMIKSEINNQEC